MKLTCERCGREFSSCHRSQKFCGTTCKNTALLKIDLQALSAFAQTGATIARISEHFKVTRQTVRFTMQRNGMQRDWQQRRFKKVQYENRR
jgi:hypothetical protein